MNSPMQRLTIPTTNMEESIKFYQNVLEMKIVYDQRLVVDPDNESLLGQDISGPYRLVNLQQGDSTVGTFGLIEFKNPQVKILPLEKKQGMPYPLVFVLRVDDVENFASKVRNSGCQVVSGPIHRDIPGQGHFVVWSFTDPNGVVLEVGQPPSRLPGQTGPISTIHRATIAVAGDKMEPSIEFYKYVLGMSVLTDRTIVFEPGQLGLGMPETVKVKVRLVILQQGDSQLGNVGLMEYIEPEMEVRSFAKLSGSPYQAFYLFHTDDLEDVLARATNTGSQILGRRQYEIPQRGKADNAVVMDPNGVAIDLIRWL